MPDFIITSPDGQKFKVSAPEGATADDALAYVKAQHQAAPPPPQSPPPAPYDPENDTAVGMGALVDLAKGLSLPGIGQGFKDIRNAGSQMIGRGLSAIAPAGSSVEKWAQDQTKIVEDRNRKNEAEYQAGRSDTGIDTGRLVGNVLGTLPFGVGMAARSLPLRIAGNAAQGAAVSAVSQPVLNPEDDGNTFWKQKGEQAALGGAGAVAAMPLTAALSRAASPNASVNPNVQALLDEGVTLTPGQMGGGVLKRLEDAVTSVPLLGDMVRNAQRGGAEDLNRAAINRVLAPLGQDLPRDINVGREAVQYAQTAVQDAYRNLLPRLNVHADQQLVGDATQILQRLQATDPNLATQFHNIFQRQVVDRFAAPGGTAPITGQTLKAMESELGEVATRYRSSALGSERALGQAVSDLQASLRDLVTRSNPQHAAELRNINHAFRNLVVVEKAAGGQGAAEGVFSPNQLSAAVKGSDRSARDRNFAAGRATMQDLSDPAKAVMPSSVPDSGTPLRMAVGGAGLGGLSYLSPYLAAPGAAVAGMYTPPGLALMRMLMARRPDWAPQAAQGLLGATPALGAASAPPAMGLLN